MSLQRGSLGSGADWGWENENSGGVLTRGGQARVDDGHCLGLGTPGAGGVLGAWPFLAPESPLWRTEAVRSQRSQRRGQPSWQTAGERVPSLCVLREPA